LTDSIEHIYQYTAVNSKGESQSSSLHLVEQVTKLSADAVIVTSMGKDTGALGNYITADGSAGRLITGMLEARLEDGLVLQVSTDGGASWHDATMSPWREWAFVDMQSHQASWTIQTRVIDVTTGKDSGVLSSQDVMLTAAATAPTIERIIEAEGVYTAEKAKDGSIVELSLTGTGAKAGDWVHIQWGSRTFDKTLTQADIAKGIAF